MTSTATQQLLNGTGTFAEEWEGACGIASGPDADGGEADADAQAAGMNDDRVVGLIEAGFAARRQQDAFLARLAATVEHRSRPSLGADGLAKRFGNRNVAQLLADRGRITMAEASRLVRVGTATAAPVSLLGERRPVPHPAVADALAAGHCRWILRM
ncbi:hypothetical protein [Glaciibacter superstes]|uniref:hypothetical protein n=1 Tax=Glaciibacter superstes TaxID=501023 RepID=UPI0003B72464|nr:hypothetical protein [Glaciibacter superstes]